MKIQPAIIPTDIPEIPILPADTILSQKIPMKLLEKSTEVLLTLLSMFPKHGHLYYKYIFIQILPLPQ